MRYKSFLLLGLVLGIFLLCACSEKPPQLKLSEMGDKDLIQHIVDSDVSIPEIADIDSIREMIIELEDDPGHLAPVLGWTVLTDFYEELRSIVKTYYEIES